MISWRRPPAALQYASGEYDGRLDATNWLGSSGGGQAG